MQNNDEVFFKIRSSATFKKLMNTYCERQSIDPQTVVFLFDGQRLLEHQTPQEVCTESLTSEVCELNVRGCISAAFNVVFAARNGRRWRNRCLHPSSGRKRFNREKCWTYCLLICLGPFVLYCFNCEIVRRPWCGILTALLLMYKPEFNGFLFCHWHQWTRVN